MKQFIDLGKRANGERLVLKMPVGEGFQLLVFGGSGSGKTNTLYQIVESMPKDRPIFIADVEQDFIPLRQHRDFVIIGKGRDFPADPELAETLAKRFLELRFSILFDAFEESRKSRQQFLGNFLRTLHDAPRSLWQPATVLIDELDRWAPEGGDSPATEHCENAAARFRKRHFDLIMATTRIAIVDKSVIANARNQLIGLGNIDVDIKRSLSFLGFTEKEDRDSYRDLQRGEFFARGPEFEIRRPEKSLISQSKLFKPNENKGDKIKAPAPKGKVLKVLAKLADLPREVVAEAKDNASLKRRVLDLERQLRDAARVRPTAPAEPTEKQVQRVVEVVRREVNASWRKTFEVFEAHWRTTTEALRIELRRVIGEQLKAPVQGSALVAAARPAPIPSRIPLRKNVTERNLYDTERAPSSEGGKFGRCERQILRVLTARQGESFTRLQLAVLSLYAHSAGNFGNALGALKSAGLVESDGKKFRFNPTSADLSKEILGENFGRHDASLEDWDQKLSKCSRAIYTVLRNEPSPLSRAELAERTSYEASAGNFGNAIGSLVSNGLGGEDA